MTCQVIKLHCCTAYDEESSSVVCLLPSCQGGGALSHIWDALKVEVSRTLGLSLGSCKLEQNFF